MNKRTTFFCTVAAIAAVFAMGWNPVTLLEKMPESSLLMTVLFGGIALVYTLATGQVLVSTAGEALKETRRNNDVDIPAPDWTSLAMAQVICTVLILSTKL